MRIQKNTMRTKRKHKQYKDRETVVPIELQKKFQHNKYLYNDFRYVIFHSISLFNRQRVPPILNHTFQDLYIKAQETLAVSVTNKLNKIVIK